MSENKESSKEKSETEPLVASSVGNEIAAAAIALSNTDKGSNITTSSNKKHDDDDNNNNNKEMSLEEQLIEARQQISDEKAGKRKLFHSLVKLANELRRTRNEAIPVLEQQKFAEKNWYEGGLWRSPQVLPGVKTKSQDVNKKRNREAISLSDLFFNLVVVTAFTRVGVAVSSQGYVDIRCLFYFAIFWTTWNKEASYTTRFDTTDLSAQMETLLTCFALLFGSLSVHAPIESIDANRIMMMAAFVSILHCLLHIRVAITTATEDTPLSKHITHYAVFIITMTILEAAVWLAGIFLLPVTSKYRWIIFLVGIVLGLRVPRAFLSNDFHAACSQRGVLFILLLGFLLQSIVVVSSEFFEYQTPTIQHYSFIGAACLMFFCIKLLYVDDSDTLAEDHALLVNRYAAFFFNMGQFSLLLSTTVMGSGLNLLTHDYMAAQAALPGPAKTLVCGGFSTTLLSTFFIKSMHLKRVPTDPRNQALFIGAYAVQTIVLLTVVVITGAMSLGFTDGGFLGYLMQTDIQLLFSLSGAALFIVIMSWLDEGVELALYDSSADSREFRVHPFGLWWCLQPEVTDEDFNELAESNTTTGRLSVLSPLLGSSMADLKDLRADYHSLKGTDSNPSIV